MDRFACMYYPRCETDVREGVRTYLTGRIREISYQTQGRHVVLPFLGQFQGDKIPNVDRMNSLHKPSCNMIYFHLPVTGDTKRRDDVI